MPIVVLKDNDLNYKVNLEASLARAVSSQVSLVCARTLRCGAFLRCSVRAASLYGSGRTEYSPEDYGVTERVLCAVLNRNRAG